MIIKYDIDKLKEMLKYFYTLTKVRVCVFDENFNEIAFYPEDPCAFCKNIKSNPYLKEKCDKCDQNAFVKCKNEGAFTYKCHMGLYESVAPIKYEDITIGFLIFGQLKIKNNNEQYKDILKKNNISTKNYDKWYKQLNYLNDEQINAAAKILDIIAGSVYIKKVASIISGELILKLEHFINDNISKELNSNIICNHLNISRTKLYILSKKFFGMSITQYITYKRINFAKNLLKTTDLSIAEVAEKAGIPDYNYFTKVFKKYEKTLPKNVKNK